MLHSSFLAVLLAVSSITGSSPDIPKAEKLPPLRQAQSDWDDLTGYYACKGEEAGGKKYSGIVSLVKKNDVYLISWVVGGGSTFSGIAIRQGNQFAASWTIQTEKGIIRGVNLYRIEVGPNGPHLVGRWSSVPGPGVQQQETLKFLKKMDPDDE